MGREARVHYGSEVSEPFPLRGFLKLPIVGLEPFFAKKMTFRKGIEGLSSRLVKDSSVHSGVQPDGWVSACLVHV